MALSVRKNVVKADLCNYSILLNGIGGVGKTTLFYQVTTKLYGEDGGLMINVGNEPQPNHIINANYLQADTFKDVIEFVDELCKGRNGAYSHIKVVGFDTLDTIYDLAEDYVLEEYNNSVDGGKEVNTIKSAYGGYQAGENRVVDLVVKTLFKLRNYGYGLWINGHTKRKTKADQLGNVEYEQLTSDLPAKYYNAIKNKVNIVGTAYIRRSFDNMKQVKDAYNKGKMKTGQMVTIVKNDGSIVKEKITKMFVNEGIKKKEVTEAYYGDIVTVAGCPEISIGDTICDPNHIDPLPSIEIEKPTLSMNFMVNTSPFAGKTGKFVTSRHLRDRLMAELERNVGLEVEELPSSDGFKVSGRGELHLSILIENMRREGYELGVSKPEVITKEIDGVLCEPYEKVIVNVPNDYSGTVISDISERKGTMELMQPAEDNYIRLEFNVPTRGLIGYRSNFITNTKGEGIMVRSFDSYKPYAGEISGRKNGVLVSMETGKTFGYALYNLLDRGTMLVEPATDVYKGMIIGIHNRENDLNVNPCKNKEFSNTRSSGSDEAIVLPKAKTYTLEEALEFIENDELVEVTPDAIRLRKKILDEKERFRSNR